VYSFVVSTPYLILGYSDFNTFRGRIDIYQFNLTANTLKSVLQVDGPGAGAFDFGK
jgi:hypothetical protein